jgi:hypothetical protein
MHVRSLHRVCLRHVNKESVPRIADQQQKHDHLYNEYTRITASKRNVAM